MILARLAAVTLAALVVGLFCLPVSAGSYSYNSSNGYYYSGGQAYSRSQYYQPSYTNSYGYCQPSYYYYSYTPVYTPPATTYTPPTAAAPAYKEGWKEEALKLARARDEYQSYLKTLDVLGFHGQPYGYSLSSYAIGKYTHGTPTYGAQANTVYGYSVSTLKDLYGETNMNTLYQQSARLTQNAQQLASQANSDFTGLVDQAGSNAGRVAEILAKATAAAAALKAAEASPSSRSSTTVTRVEGSTVPRMPEAPSGEAGATATGDFLRLVGALLCGPCHSGGTVKGNFDIGKYQSMTIEQKRRVWATLRSRDPKKRMPRSADGGPGPELTAEQFDAFLAN